MPTQLLCLTERAQGLQSQMCKHCIQRIAAAPLLWSLGIQSLHCLCKKSQGLGRIWGRVCRHSYSLLVIPQVS
jgi:hypothetical protein